MQQLWKSRLVLTAFLAIVCLACTPTQVDTPLSGTPPGSSPESQELSTATIPVANSLSTSRIISSITGGEISLDTPDGGQVLLSIPPFAFTEDTPVTLTLHTEVLASPFSQNFFPGLSLQPDGLSLRLPATLSLDLPGYAAAPGQSLFYLKQPGLALPIWQAESAGTTTRGLLTHFSDYIGGSPSPDEAQSQASAAGELDGNFPDQWQDRLEGTQALTDWGNGLNSMGMGDEGSAAADRARERLIKDLECLMNLDCAPPYPLDPCGDYLQMLMQYYTQANLLAIDPESAMMDFLYRSLEEVLNQCTNRYSLEYSHNLKTSQMGLEEDIRVTGNVFFIAPIYGVFELGEPLKLEGSGTVSVSISGQAIVDDETCTLDGSGTHDVSIAGQIEADETGNPWIALDVTENWYTSGSLTITCPDGDSQSVPLPAAGSQTYPLRFQYEDGAKSMAPNLGGMSGEYVWILHIAHTW